MLKNCKLVMGLSLVGILMPRPAYAYIDHGLGSLFVQSVVAGIVAVGAAWAGFKFKVLSFLDRRRAGPKAKK